MRSRWVSFAASLLLAVPATAAVVREQRVTIEVQPAGSVRERVYWRVQIDNATDFARWSPFPIYLDDHRKLVRVEASATAPGGKPQPVRRRGRNRTGLTGEGVLHASSEAELVEFPSVPDGGVLSLEYEVEERPYFPSGVVELGGLDGVELLHVEVRAPGLRARLADPPAGVTLRQDGDTVLVTGALRARAEVAQAPSTSWPTLRYGWGPPADWAAVGGWYRDLVAAVPRDSAAVRETAQRLVAGVTDRRQMLERLLAFVRRDVRYVAVEIGVGGYRPSPPADVLDRRWGDCKDKAMLLVDLLAAVGIEGRLVLVRSDDEGTIDTAFPAPDQFNHAIAAIRKGALQTPPAAGGDWLFIDATQSTGGLSWLSDAVAGQHGLVITPAGGELVQVPLAIANESENLTVTAQLAPDGSARGSVRVDLGGGLAAAFARRARTVDRSVVLADTGEMLTRELPGAAFEKLELWSNDDDGPPKGRLTAALSLPSLTGNTESGFSLLLPASPTWPSPAITEDRTLPIALSPGTADTEWRLTLPRTGCHIESAAVAVDNPAGAFRQDAQLTGTSLVLRRHSEQRLRELRPDQFPDLVAVAAAEHRALKRRLRLDCSP